MTIAFVRSMIVFLTFISCVACQDVEKAFRYGQAVLPSEPPFERVETLDDGVTLSVGLSPGVRLSQVVDLGVLSPLRPGIKPDEARQQFGVPAAVYGVGHEKHYVYRTPETTVAIVETDAISSADGSKFKAYQVRAKTGPQFEESMAPALRRLIANHPRTTTVRVVSRDASDLTVHLHLRSGAVQQITAWPPLNEGTLSEEP